MKRFFKLKNGIRVLIIPTNTNLTNVSVSILLGQNHEKITEIELTHYMEHLIGRFTSSKYSDYKLISNELHKRGAFTNAYVDDYETKFYISGFYKDIEYYLDILANTINNFKFNQSLIKQEKNAVIQELRNFMDDSDYLFDLKIYKYMYPKYYYQFDYKKHIQNIKEYNVNRIYNFIKSHILLKNVLLTITCPSNKIAKTEKLIRKYWNFYKPSNKSIQYSNFIYKNKGLKILYIHNHQNDINTSLRINIGIDISYLSKDHICLLYLKKILCNFETGLFYKTLRDKYGLIYNLHMNIDIDKYNPKYSMISIDTNIKYDKLPELIDKILDIIENIVIKKEDIKNIKKSLLIDNEMKKFNDLTSQNEYYTDFLLFKNKIIELNDVNKIIKKLNYNDINNIITLFKKSILKNGLIFYYSKYNMNRYIKSKAKRDIKYLVL
jgi:predicted Zn-dependent peptidase